MRSKPVYRSIMEKKIGRSLNRYEVVHHLNGNHDDNRIENLVVVSRAEHAPYIITCPHGAILYGVFEWLEPADHADTAPEGPLLPKRKRRAELRFQRLSEIPLSLQSSPITVSVPVTSVVESNTPDGTIFRDAATESALRRMRLAPFTTEN